MPCYSPWDNYLKPGTDGYAKARARVETMAAAMQHVVDAYLQLHGVEPPRGRVEIPFCPDAVELRPFELGKMSLSMLHRITQHCLCDDIGHIELRDIASILDEADRVSAIYSAIALDAARAISLGLAFRTYDRTAYEAHEWAIRCPSLSV